MSCEVQVPTRCNAMQSMSMTFPGVGSGTPWGFGCLHYSVLLRKYDGYCPVVLYPPRQARAPM